MNADGDVQMGALRLDEAGAEARWDGVVLPLTFAQRRVLLALARRRGRCATRDEIYLDAFGRRLPPGGRAVDVHIGRIRRALGQEEDCIVCVPRVGYRLDVEKLAQRGAMRSKPA